MSEVQIEFSRTRGDILSGITANTLRSPGALVWYVVGALTVASIAVIVNWDEGVEVIASAGAIVFALMLFVYAVVVTFCVLYAAQKTWRAPGAFDPITLTFSDEGLHAKAAVGDGFSQWIVWTKAFETRKLIVIRHQFNLIQIVPKRGLSEATLAAVRAILQAHVANVQLQSNEMRSAP